MRLSRRRLIKGTMDILTIVLLAAVALLGLVLVLVLTRRGVGEAETMRQQLALALSQQAETVQRVERSLREQEQALSKVVGERLDRTEKATGQIVTDLRERLVRIDEAQKKIGDLSTQVVGLQEVLSNKQARGAFAVESFGVVEGVGVEGDECVETGAFLVEGLYAV